MTHTIEVYVHVRGQFLRCVTDTVTDIHQVSPTIRLIMATERFSEPRAVFVVMVNGEILAEGEY